MRLSYFAETSLCVYIQFQMLTEELSKCREVIILNAKSCLRQPELYSKQSYIHQQFVELCIGQKGSLLGKLDLKYITRKPSLSHKKINNPVLNTTGMFTLNIIGIKHGFSCINIRQVLWEVLKTEAEGRSFQHLPRDLAIVNSLKNHVRSLLLHKNWKHLLHFALFLALFCFAFSQMSRKCNFHGLCSF